MAGWVLVEKSRHRIFRDGSGIWAMYCPQRGPDSLILAISWFRVLEALERDTGCPHDDLLRWRVRR